LAGIWRCVTEKASFPTPLVYLIPLLLAACRPPPPRLRTGSAVRLGDCPLRVPSGLNATSRMCSSPSPLKESLSWPVLTPQTLIAGPLPHETSWLPSGLNVRFRASRWPCRLTITWPVTAFHNPTNPSTKHAATRVPSALIATLFHQLGWPWRSSQTSRPVATSQTL
jgi:hypothetical protein